ncbi:UDP-N-acetylmuramate:L-alanyl-gamma-D-glutamyl-meso-diaminopimelate ligase [Deferrisoma sp.]
MFNQTKQFSSISLDNQHLHFLGICGTAMASVAVALHRLGVRVTGSDQAMYPPMSEVLAAAGVPVSDRFDPANLDPPPDLVVVGNAISRGNPELEAVLDRDLERCSLPELLGRAFLPGRKGLVVAGTHGKTTTSALCAWALEQAGRKPSWLVGGVPRDMEGGFRLGEGEWFVLEGDEYDTAFFDKRPKFVHYRPRILVLNNLEYDHADIYPDLPSLRRAFLQAVRIVPRTGALVANADDPEVMTLVRDAPCPVVTYSARGNPAEWTGEGGEGELAARGPEGRTLALRYALVGPHQAWNVLAAAAALTLAGLSPGEIEEAVESFPGVRRRAELRGEAAGVAVYDDFAHHPTAIRSTLEGFRRRFPGRRLWAVVEPRSNTMRRRVFQGALVGAFDAADRVCLREVPNPEKVPPEDRLDVDRLARDLTARGVPARAFPDAGAIVEFLAAEARPGDVVVVLSNGGFEGIHERLLEALRGRA